MSQKLNQGQEYIMTYQIISSIFGIRYIPCTKLKVRRQVFSSGHGQNHSRSYKIGLVLHVYFNRELLDYLSSRH